MSSTTASTIDALKRLRESLTRKPPYVSGTLPVQPDDLILFFGKEDISQYQPTSPSCALRLNYATAGLGRLDALSQACDRASFGVDNQTVLDDTYRKAGKLDTAFFSTPFVPERSRLVEVIRGSLLEGKDATRPIHIELYKLNVYDEGSFFKPHKDTPRSGSMFASLVVVFPTLHEGGALVLRHGGEEWTFDSAQVLASAAPPSVAYISFFSDVEHEVLPVTKGHRVTLTYNIYYADVDDDPNLPAALPSMDPLAASSHGNMLLSALKDLLDAPDFLPKGGALGFGLRHVYPVLADPGDSMSGSLDRVRRLLKGPDALVLQACTALDLDARLYFVYSFNKRTPTDPALDEAASAASLSASASGFHEDLGQLSLIMTEQTIVEHDRFNMESSFKQRIRWGSTWHVEKGPPYLMGIRSAVVYNFGDERSLDMKVSWVTVPNSWTKISQPMLVYGNETSLGWTYVNVCLVVRVGQPGRRWAWDDVPMDLDM
ncbi:hypothetical protein FA95DRAFT_1574651 [Auriscalpium vulgare]|uniref:Uncharacterized protein n=1 Tax=Auriscalpium vulgare TaxID=40419 RepID=A0ACB8RKP2_9AGAM|nr:hypothetical protein FA95DRAFT_1574651 [Auriscalpium vulgare]